MNGLATKNVDRDTVMIFVICYEYSISFTNMMKLFNISRKYFWTFMEVCSPMIKMGVRKAACLRKTVDKIMECLNKGDNDLSDLSPREENIYEALTWCMEDSFTDGDSCLHISQLENMPFAQGYASNGLMIARNFNSLKNELDRVSYVKIGDTNYYKTSRFLYYMEKYSGDTDFQELNSLSVKEMLKRIDEGERKLHEKEKTECFSRR